jgi:DNA-binding MarR family transcriptional regulator
MAIAIATSKYVTAYLDFVDRRDSLREQCNLSMKECLVLRLITRQYLKEEAFRVKQLLEMNFIASPATIHGIIKKLVAKKAIKLIQDKHDARVKYLVPSTKSINLLAELGKLVR